MAMIVRQIYEDMPLVLVVPPSLQRKRVEVIMLSLDEIEAAIPCITDVDEYGWPIGLFERLTNSWQHEAS